MKRLRSRLLAGIASLSLLEATAILPPIAAVEYLLITEPAHADLPVIDITAITDAIQQFVQMLKDYVVDVNNMIADINSEFTEEEQLATQIKQLTTMLDQYVEVVFMAVNFIHAPSVPALLGILTMAGIRIDTLPLNVYSLYGLMSGYRSGGFLGNWQGMPGQVESIFNTTSAADMVYRCNDPSFSCKHQQEKADAASGFKSAAGQVVTDIQNHNTALNSIRDTLNGASDPKTVQDATGQAVVESGWSINNATRALAVIGIGMAQHDIMQNQADQMYKQSADRFLAQVP